MRNVFLTGVSATALVLGLAAAHAEDHASGEAGYDVWSDKYISLFGGVSLSHDAVVLNDGVTENTSFDEGFTIGGAFGTYLTPALRAELELSYQRHGLDSFTDDGNSASEPRGGHFESYNVLLNLWHDINVDAAFTPYVGAGIGASYAGMTLDDWQSGDKGDGFDPAFVSQFGAGVRFDLSDRSKLDLGYRFRSVFGMTGRDSDHRTMYRVDQHSHTLQVGLTHMLGDGAMEDALEEAGVGSNYYYSGFAGVIVAGRDMLIDDGGYSYEVHNKTGFTLGGAVGTSVAPYLRTELEATFQNYGQDGYSGIPSTGVEDGSGSTNIFTLTTNVWKDINKGYAIVPYVGGGVGVGVVNSDGEMDGTDWDDTAVGMALQFGAGINYAVSDNVAVNIGYRARGVFGAGLESHNDNDHTAGNFLSHSVQVGVTYGYGLFGMHDEQDNSADPMMDDHYVSLFGGYVIPENALTQYDSGSYDLQFKNGFSIGGAIGTHVMPSVRGELEFAYQQYELCGAAGSGTDPDCDFDSDFEDPDVHTYSVLANTWKDFDLGAVAPYLGGGLGLGVIHLEDDSYGDPALAMAGQVGGGLRVAVTEDLTLDLGYRFKGFFDPLLSGDHATDLYYAAGTHFSHNFIGGVSWGF